MTRASIGFVVATCILSSSAAVAATYSGNAWSRPHSCEITRGASDSITGSCTMGASQTNTVRASITHYASFTNLAPSNGIYRITYENTSYLEVAWNGSGYTGKFYSSEARTETPITLAPSPAAAR